MRSKNPEIMKKIVVYIDEYFRQHKETPTLQKIADRVSLGKSSVHRYLMEMSDRDIISFCNGVIETPLTAKYSKGQILSPKAGNVLCGDPTEEGGNIEEYIGLPSSIFGDKDCYILTARGDSMEDAGISAGDYLVIEPAKAAKVGEIVVALDDENKNTLKKYGGYNEETGMYELKYCNEAVYPNKVIECKSPEVQGVLRFVIKKMS